MINMVIWFHGDAQCSLLMIWFDTDDNKSEVQRFMGVQGGEFIGRRRRFIWVLEGDLVIKMMMMIDDDDAWWWRGWSQ